MKLEWHPLAEADREEIFDYIEDQNPAAAIAVDERIAEQVLMLVRFPEAGRLGRVEGTRELVIQRTPYIVAYRVEQDAVLLLRVLHSSLLWPDELPR